MWKFVLFIYALIRHRGTVRAHAPLALHHLYEVSHGEEVVISLRGHDLDGDKASYGRFYFVSFVNEMADLF